MVGDDRSLYNWWWQSIPNIDCWEGNRQSESTTLQSIPVIGCGNWFLQSIPLWQSMVGIDSNDRSLERKSIIAINNRNQTLVLSTMAFHTCGLRWARMGRLKVQGGERSRTCKLCHSAAEDAMHFLLVCPALQSTREMLLSRAPPPMLSA